jgi:hypothetical protein
MLTRLDPTIANKIKTAIRNVEMNLSNENYEGAIKLTYNSRLSPQEIEAALKKHGGKVTVAPDIFFNSLQVIEIRNSQPKSWAVGYDLWIDGKRSDLTLSLTVSLVGDDVTSTIDDLHIL